MSIVTGVSLFPLQDYTYKMSDFWKPKGDTGVGAVLFLIGIAVTITILIIVNAMRKRGKVPALNSGAVQAAAPRRFSAFTLRRIASGIGLNRDQAKMLDYIFKNDAVANPEQSLNSPDLLDRHFKRTYRIIERASGTEDEAQQRLSLLFSTRNVIESNAGSVSISSTRQIPENASAVLNTGQGSYPVKIVSAKGEQLFVESPLNASGSPVSVSRGGKVTLSFFTKTSRGFSFESRVLGNSVLPVAGQVLQLAHSSRVTQLSQRRFRRRQVVIAADFFFVYLEDAGRGKKKMVVDKRRLTGNITDISVGGCSIKTSASVPSGTRLKIEFNQDNTASAALGQVLRTNRSGISTIMHIKFLKLPRKSMNVINALVFDYLEN